MTATIPRMKFTQVDESLADTRIQLAMDAKAKLGYDRLAKAIAIPGALMFALRKLEIEPLVKSSVESYMAEKAKPGMWSGPKHGIAQLLGISVAWLTLGVWLITLPKSAPDFPGIAACVGLILMAVATVVLSIDGFQLLLGMEYRGHRTTRKWRSFPLGQFAGNIPEFALGSALRIQAEVPNAHFSVSQLHEETEKIERPLRDPFLIVTLGDESYYIEVWDEKEYEAKL